MQKYDILVEDNIITPNHLNDPNNKDKRPNDEDGKIEVMMERTSCIALGRVPCGRRQQDRNVGWNWCCFSACL
jgi:hypothetical protein